MSVIGLNDQGLTFILKWIARNEKNDSKDVLLGHFIEHKSLIIIPENVI